MARREARRTDVGTTPKRTPRPLAAVVLAAGKGEAAEVRHPQGPASGLRQARSCGTCSRLVRAAKPARIVVVVGHGADDVRDAVRSWDMKPTPVFVEQAEQLGTGHAVAARREGRRQGRRRARANGDFDPMTLDDIGRSLRVPPPDLGRRRRSRSAVLDDPAATAGWSATAAGSSTSSRTPTPARRARDPRGLRRLGRVPARGPVRARCRCSIARTASASTT